MSTLILQCRYEQAQGLVMHGMGGVVQRSGAQERRLSLP